MAAGGAWLQNVINLTSAAFAIPLLCLALLIGAVMWMTGNKREGQGFLVGGLIGFAILTGINQIASQIPRIG